MKARPADTVTTVCRFIYGPDFARDAQFGANIKLLWHTVRFAL